jgi:hypothetical protein
VGRMGRVRLDGLFGGSLLSLLSGGGGLLEGEGSWGVRIEVLRTGRLRDLLLALLWCCWGRREGMSMSERRGVRSARVLRMRLKGDDELLLDALVLLSLKDLGPVVRLLRNVVEEICRIVIVE